MSKAGTAHTPGPWQYMADSLEIVRADDVQPVIATVHIDNTSDAQALADARLIAATPDMLEALRPFAAFLEAMDEMGGNFPKTGSFYTLTSHNAGQREITVEHFRAARAAIQRATA